MKFIGSFLYDWHEAPETYGFLGFRSVFLVDL